MQIFLLILKMRGECVHTIWLMWFLLLTSWKGTSKQEYLHAYIIIFTQKSLRRPASEALSYVYKCSCIWEQLNLVDLSRKSFMLQVPLLFRELYCQHFLRSLLSTCCFLSAWHVVSM